MATTWISLRLLLKAPPTLHIVSVFLSYVGDGLEVDRKPKRLTAALVARMTVEVEVQSAGG